MLVALLAGFLILTSFGGGFAFRLFDKDMQAAVNEVVADEARAAAAVEIIKQGRNDLEDASKRFEEIAKGFRAADEEQSAGLDVLTPFVEQAIEARRSGQAAVLDRVFELRDTLTASEWEAALASLSEEQ
jgi:hypothetical protein